MLRLHSVKLPATRFYPVLIPLLVIGVLLIHHDVQAQDGSTGAVRGVVLDSQKAALPNALVVLVNFGNGLRYSASTDAEGRFVLELLPPGDYSARAEAEGMSPQVLPQLHVDLGAEQELSFSLTLAGVKETVTVSGATPLVETQPSAVSTLIDDKAISELPLNGRRFTDLSLLAPGVSKDPRGLNSGANGDLAFGGIRGYQSSYLVDGADNNNSFFGQARGRSRAPYQFSNAVVQEFRISSNAYGAELGRAGGAVVNVVTKSGSNHWHGTGFYYIRDAALNAQPAFTDSKPSDRQQQFGFTLGGPIKKSKVFFFGGYDQHIFHVPIMTRFVDGSATIVPQPGTLLNPGDYEASDKDLVFAAAAHLNSMAGNYPAGMSGNATFFKIDTSLTPKHYLSARFNTSRYWGSNNVFLDTASPMTDSMTSANGEEDVSTESASLSLTSSISPRITSHLRGQFSRDLQQSYANSLDPLTRIYSITDGFGRATIVPRRTREHRLHLAETVSLESGRNSWKFGGDALFTWVSNFFPSLSGGEYIFDNIRVNPWTFKPMVQGLKLTPLRAYAHQVPRYYVQNFGTMNSNPDTNEYAAFVQDNLRVTSRLAVSLGVRYDLHLFSTKELATNPLWPDSGKVPNHLTHNFAPRVGLAYSIGDHRPLVIRSGYGWFYTRIPQIYPSTAITNNGAALTHLALNHSDYYDRQVFPQYPYPLINCPPTASSCEPPASLTGFLQSQISAFSPNFRTPMVQQASLSLEKDMGGHLAAGVNYLYVHGQNLIRARDVNLPLPTEVSYPVYDSAGSNFLGSYYNVESFSTWQMTPSLTCPYPPCVNPLARPIPQLGSINEYESKASSVYNGLTVSLYRRMTSGFYFRLSYTLAHAIDDGQDALVAGRPVTVQNSFSTSSERGPSVTDQRNRIAFSWVALPQPFDRTHDVMSTLFNHWKLGGVLTYGSGRPVDARVTGDPNQDGNIYNDRLPGWGRNAFIGPDYATTDLRLSREFHISEQIKVEVMAESFNLLNRDNQRTIITDDGFTSSSGHFVTYSNTIAMKKFPAYYASPASFMKATAAYAPRQVQLGLKLIF
jgi:hypothetical protein